MLFNYRYVPHDIEKLQTWLDHIVKVVWCRNVGNYSLDLLHPDLRAVIEEIADDDRIKTDYLDGPIKTIDALFQSQLTAAQRAQISLWYDHNNDIERLCANDPQRTPGTYADIKRINADLEKALRGFCKSLFTDVLLLKAVTRRTAEIDAHYDAFVAENDEGKCPYCGYGDIKGQHHSRREAYDHFLPKGTYPFNSVNFKNLAPMCHECNSSYKLKTDPIRRKVSGTRRKAFYSYAAAAPDISIELTLSSANIGELHPSDITLVITAPGQDEEVDSWMDVFGIEERYRAKCCGKNDGKCWLIQAFDECANAGSTPTAVAAKDILQKIEQNAKAFPWADANFLKLPFLWAYQKANVI